MRARALLVVACLCLLSGCTADPPDHEAHQPASTTAATLGEDADIKDFGAVCDGVHDDRSALEAAVHAVNVAGGGTVSVPAGRCRIHATAEHPYVEVGNNVTVLGAGVDRTTLLLDTDSPESYRELLRLRGSGITVSGLTMEQAGPVYGVMTRIDASQNLAIYDVRIQGHQEQYPGSTLHGIMLPEEGTVEKVLLERLQVSGVQYGLLQTSEAQTVVRQVIVDDSDFHDNAADDLEFNSPNGRMSAITVRNSNFGDGQGYAVALANVTNALIQGNKIHGYTQEFVHIEDGSKDVRVTGNSFSGNRTNSNDWYSFVFVISGSRHVTIEGNRFTTDPSLYPFRCIYVGPGGDGSAIPTGITVDENAGELAGNATLIDVYGNAGVTVRR